MLGKKLIEAASGNAAAGPSGALDVDNVFSTFLHTGNGGTQTITNGIDLAGEGGLVWIKSRSDATGPNLQDTNNGTGTFLSTWEISANRSVSNGITAFNSDGFTLGSGATYSRTNTSSSTYVSWTFRKAPKFFDVVTYTGTGSARTVAHNLGSVPGCILVKRTDVGADWQVYHRSLANTEYLVLNGTAAKATGTTRWNSTTPNDSVFSLGTDSTVNASGGTYVAYLFAHDAGGFGDDETQSVIKCGNYTSSTRVQLGWEPQFVIIKGTESTGAWEIFDTARGVRIDVTEGSARLEANTSSAEASSNRIAIDSTGFTTNFISGVYIAIRRGPINTPTDATKVFFPYAATTPGNAVVTTGFPVDFQIQKNAGVATDTRVASRLTGVSTTPTSPSAAFPFLVPSSTAAESTGTGTTLNWNNTGFTVASAYSASTPAYALNFRRAPGFFDVVAYVGDGTSNGSYNVGHSLGVAPEFIIAKRRDSTNNWNCYHTGLTSATYQIGLNIQNSQLNIGQSWGPASSTFKPQFAGNATYSSNTSGAKYIAYLFATCPGVSKVGSYTGTGTTLNIDCGFTAGARFVLIKRTDSSGDWYYWDTARGIVSGNDPYLLLNSSAAQNTGTDYIDPLASGFQISSTAPADINALGGSFIFLAIA